MAVTEHRRPMPDQETLSGVDWHRVVISYDRASDTLMVHLYGRGRPAVSVPIPGPVERDVVFLRIDPETDELVGVQIEDFLNLYARDNPDALNLLEGPVDLRGITPADLARIRASIGRPTRGAATAESLIRELALAG
jgi:hypothetical protein